MTPELLRAATGCTRAAAGLYAEHLTAAWDAYSVDTPTRVAAFLAQVGHESGGLSHVREIWGPTPAQERYEGRRDLGNTEPGDGARYRGRGLIQCTGRTNYRAMANELRRFGAPDFEAEPEAMEQPQWAAWSAAAWWDTHGCNELADVGNFEGLTRRINGGLTGLEDREQRHARAQIALGILHGDPAPTEPAPSAPRRESRMPIPAFLLAALPAIIEAIPKLGRVFGSGSVVAERNLKAAELVASTVVSAVGASNEQEAVTKLQTDPAAVQVATRAVDAIWFELTEAAGGGIEGARKADATQRAAGDLLHSASFWIALTLLPLVYLLVLSLIGVVGSATWSDDVRAGLAGSLISAVIGGLVGYYYGQTTSRNRTTP